MYTPLLFIEVNLCDWFALKEIHLYSRGREMYVHVPLTYVGHVTTEMRKYPSKIPTINLSLIQKR